MKAKIYRVSDTASFNQMQERAVKAEARVKELDDQLRDLSYTFLNLRVEMSQLREHNQELVRLLESTRPAMEYCRDACKKSQSYEEAASYEEGLRHIDTTLNRVAGEATKQEP